jgi:hypothetical protein
VGAPRGFRGPPPPPQPGGVALQPELCIRRYSRARCRSCFSAGGIPLLFRCFPRHRKIGCCHPIRGPRHPCLVAYRGFPEPRRTSLSSASSQVPCQSSPPTQVTPAHLFPGWRTACTASRQTVWDGSESRPTLFANGLKPPRQSAQTICTRLPLCAERTPASRTRMHLTPSVKSGAIGRSSAMAWTKSATACTKPCS